MQSRSALKNSIKAEAHRLGFLLAGFTSPDAPEHYREYLTWLERGRHAGMNYLASDRHKLARQDPASLMPEVRSILCLALPYDNPEKAIRSADSAGNIIGGRGRVSSYAWGRDYHDVLDEKVKHLMQAVCSLAGNEITWRAFTDSGPVLERDLAQRAGLGWIGKNTLLINPKFGSYFFLTEVFTDLELEPDPPFTSDQCGSCRRCIEACPTDAILENRTLEAGRCISYLTIENKNEIPAELMPGLGEWLFGCDVCQMVCPWNIRFGRSAPDPALESTRENSSIDLLGELALDDVNFRMRYRGRPLLRPKRSGHLRNALVVLGNHPIHGSDEALGKVLSNERDPRLRALAARALGAVGSPIAQQFLKKAEQHELAPQVLEEIRLALANCE